MLYHALDINWITLVSYFKSFLIETSPCNPGGGILPEEKLKDA